jgi:antitoxin (DNA-binding transcriptional repressor) of toxin-antitoxin stability system
MTTYSIAEAQKNLPELIEKARNGEGVVITDGRTAPVEVRLLEAADANGLLRVVTKKDANWLKAHVVKPVRPPLQDAGDLVSAMRDEDAH